MCKKHLDLLATSRVSLWISRGTLRIGMFEQQRGLSSLGKPTVSAALFGDSEHRKS
jgi:hypothetical protein